LLPQEILALALGFSEVDLALDEMTLKCLNPYEKPESSLSLDECKKLKVVDERKREKLS
jgi:hypothetical protein